MTHDPRAASYADRVVFLADGQIVQELARPSADDVFEVMKNLDGVHHTHSSESLPPRPPKRSEPWRHHR